jgi:coenzyme F420-reducing hydrogenase beta subunit
MTLPGKSSPFAAWANDENLRSRSTSGGIFAAMAVETLADGGVVAGAAIEGVVVRHICIESADELYRLQGSKYQQGDTTGIFRSVKRHLDGGRKVLFSGVPCQVSGLYAFLGGKRYEGRLTTADLICGGFPSALTMESFVRNEPDVVSLVSFRRKSPGEHPYSLVTVDAQENEKNHGYRNLPISAFSSHMTQRPSCLKCRFANAHRPSDITLADFWGDKQFPDQHDRGLSVVITHSPRGEQALEQADVTLHPVGWKDFAYRNFRMVCGSMPWRRLHPMRMCFGWLLRKAPYGLQKRLFSVEPSIILLPHKAIMRVIFKLDAIWIRRNTTRKLNEITEQR